MTQRHMPDAMPKGDANARGADSAGFPMLSARVRDDRTTAGMTVTHSEHRLVRPQHCGDLKRQSWAKWDRLRATLTRAARDFGDDAINPLWERVLDGLDDLQSEVDRMLTPTGFAGTVSS